MILHAQDHYMNAQIKTASPGDLTLMLYNGCIRFMKQAIGCIERSDIEGKHTFLVKAQNIIVELRVTLNLSYDISHNLNSLYEYIGARLTEANVKQDKDIITECISLISDLRDTWGEVLKMVKKSESSTV